MKKINTVNKKFHFEALWVCVSLIKILLCNLNYGGGDVTCHATLLQSMNSVAILLHSKKAKQEQQQLIENMSVLI